MNIRMLNPDTKFLSGDGRPVAVIGLTPDVLAERYGIEFVRGADDFDYYQTAVIALPNGPITRLLRYAHDPDPGTAVYADSQLDVEQAQKTVSNLLGLTRSDFTWLAKVRDEVYMTEPEGIMSRQAKATGEVDARNEVNTETQRVSDTVRREEVRGEDTSNPIERVDRAIGSQDHTHR